MLQNIINSSILVTSYFIVLIRTTRCKRIDLEHINSIPFLVSSFLRFRFRLRLPARSFEFRVFLARKEILPGKHTI